MDVLALYKSIILILITQVLGVGIIYVAIKIFVWFSLADGHILMAGGVCITGASQTCNYYLKNVFGGISYFIIYLGEWPYFFFLNRKYRTLFHFKDFR